MQEKTTINYYEANVVQFTQSTLSIDFTATQNRFLAKIPPSSHILDFGCGSGRDTKYFSEQGFHVTPIDGSLELCKFAAQYTGIPVRHMLFQELDEQEIYEGIWACSSILHLPQAELVSVFQKMVQALKNKGIIYTSFKYGIFEGERNGRYFTDMTEDKFSVIMKKIMQLEIEEQWITSDVRPGRGDEKWLNLILRKR